MNETSESLIAYCRENNRVCPQPKFWHQLWDMLPNRRQVEGSWQPSLPLILAAWYEAPVLLKMLRLAEHIQWAEKHNSLSSVSAFLLICEKKIGFILENNSGAGNELK